ncbi:mandelate racemase/muconate lactonizing enzyme family protein [Humitalea sp. 24SJ18S-53]|uniref:mandelate racemase/muconate lactonizing enzyme family protein n=1 Tax=Humitalea sp. 24SJ18S-53 TaxID=3422307 RepID=UPI003D673FF1
MTRIAAIAFVGVNITPKTNWSFLRVQDSDGRIGWGECTLGGQEAGMAAEAARLAANVVGEPVDARNRLCRLLPHAPGGLLAHTVRSAFEQALWDLAGQAMGQPIHALLGGRLREKIPLYANINRGVAQRTPDGFAAAALRAKAAGFGGVKLAPFDPLVWEDPDRAAYAEGLSRIAAVRDAIGPDVALMVDCHWRFSPGGAAALVRDVAPQNLFWLECPVAEANHAATRRLRHMANDRGMRLAGAESLCGLAAYAAIIAAGCHDVLMPDIKHAGGHEEIRRIAALALTQGVEIAPHNPTGPLCHAHSLHLCATIPNLLPLEVQFGESEAFFTLAPGHALAFDAGSAHLPMEPGVGVGLDEAWAGQNPWVPMPRPWLDPRLG